ncbi:MOSC domain-containing protein [Shimia biformata]|uniref:MOSC domain-containing protein n=1 Tax=Shimia biformata TaxID=1294299 RepID=UPI00194EB655|nr:MOSC N-terminal beta barrel domain-containing protein [Shimia biformata]
MTIRIAQIWRHPIKAHGREPLDHVTLTKGRTLPWDRRWAVAHEASKADGSEWVPCANFSRGAKAPELMAVAAQSDLAANTVTLSHPDRPDLTFDPDGDAAAFLDWVRPLMPQDRAASTRLIRVPGRGMTDTNFPSIALNNLASHRAVEGRLGRSLSPLRWRGNILFDGAAPWEEFDWIGKSLRIGGAELTVRERIGRCLATTANPETGKRDANTLGILKEGWNHTDFGVYAEVTMSGQIAVDDKIEVL